LLWRVDEHGGKKAPMEFSLRVHFYDGNLEVRVPRTAKVADVKRATPRPELRFRVCECEFGDDSLVGYTGAGRGGTDLAIPQLRTGEVPIRVSWLGQWDYAFVDPTDTFGSIRAHFAAFQIRADASVALEGQPDLTMIQDRATVMAYVPFTLTLNGPEGEKVFFKVNPQTKIEKLYIAWGKRQGIDPDHVILYFHNERCEEGHVLSEYGMQAGDRVEVFMRQVASKPAIYLYPPEPTRVRVALDFRGEFGVVYPSFTDAASQAWDVEATPTGEIAVLGRRVPYLFWEGELHLRPDMSEGSVVPRAETAAFLERSVRSLGLSEKEAFEFVVFWAPKLRKNAVNAVTFLTESYATACPLIVEPKPDTEIRVFMLWREAEAGERLRPQELKSPERVGFTLVEWGGGKVSKRVSAK
jgi:hypothetical protein